MCCYFFSGMASRKRLKLSSYKRSSYIGYRWLSTGVDVSDMPPPSFIKGLSNVLYEGLRLHCQGRLLLYPLSAIIEEGFIQCSTMFGELTMNTPGGLRPTVQAVSKFMTDACIIQAIRSDCTKYKIVTYSLLSNLMLYLLT